MPAVAFDYAKWAARFPELASTVAEPLAQAYFDEACLFVSNSDGSPISSLNARALILNLTVAHIAQLNKVSGTQGGAQLVGRISSATEGSVTAQAQLDVKAESAQWWAQTTYGLSAWQAMAPYRTARFFPGHQRVMNPWIGGYPR